MKQLNALILTAILCPLLYTFGYAQALTSLAALNESAKQKVNATSNVPLAADGADCLNGADVLETGKMPNYVRALSLLPKAAAPMAATFKTYLYGGTIQPETKMAMGLRIAQVYGSAYPAVHLQRLLRASERGKVWLTALQSNQTAGASALNAREQAALRYGELLTRDIHGVSDLEFAKTRASFNDAQVVELTMTTAFFNYFLRYCEAANLPVEKWALDEPVAKVTPAKYETPAARVALVSDEQMTAAASTLAAAKEQAKNPNGLGIGIANSQRAFMLVPDIYNAWRAFTTPARDYTLVSREIKLHVSFAISMANGCRYCTLHQVQGLRRLGVNPTKLMAMAKDDSALTPRELAAVTFARKITKEPTRVSKADYDALVKEFEPQGALEVLLQCGNFAYMNRFTDGLRLPSEDEAIHTYLETYGSNFEQVRKASPQGQR